MFLDYDVFNTIYNIAIKDNFDIVEYKGIRVWGLDNLLNKKIRNTYFSSHKKNLILYQPELGNYPLKFSNDSKNIYILDNYLWNKCIKTEIYQKALNIFGEERYKRRMIFHEDLIMVIILFNTAESFRFIEKYGMLNIGRPGSASSLSKDLNLLEMYLIDAAIDFSKKTFENKKTIAQFVTFLLNKNNLNKTLENNENKKLLNSILKRTYSCEYISEEDKNNIRNISLNILKINDDNNTK